MYWFFRTHHHFVPIINCVAQCVSNNAVSLSVFQNNTNNPEVLGYELSKCKVYISEHVPKALQLLVPLMVKMMFFNFFFFFLSYI